jgi:subtilase family serine protease
LIIFGCYDQHAFRPGGILFFKRSIMRKRFFGFATLIAMMFAAFAPAGSVQAAYRFANFKAHPPIHIRGSAAAKPSGMTPAQIKTVYHLPASGGTGTVAIIGAYDDKTIEQDLNVFSQQFQLPACTTANGCFEKHPMAAKVASNSGWAMETSLDVEWAHAIAPQAKILLVEATTPSGTNLLKAVDYASARPDVVAVSMSWGGSEFSDETTLDQHFTSNHNVTFFASSGDDGAGASWPAASPNVVAVGGTTLALSATGTFSAETAWSGSGGGVSAYETEPAFQQSYNISKAKGQRAIPDVAYDADPASGFPIYRSVGKSKNGWYTVGGTSAGAPQWAAIKALGGTADNSKFYTDKASAGSTKFFRDIKSGNNGDCGYYCNTRSHYDYVTGLGSPLTEKF